MPDFSERDVTGLPAADLGQVIQGLLLQSSNRSVELFMRGSRMILRVWFIDFDLSEFSDSD